MESTVLVALISFAGTLLGTLGGIIASSKLTDYRLEQLEKKMESNIAATAKIPLIEEKLNGLSGRIRRLEREDYSSSGYLDNCQ